jgi:hypothetical protein
MCFGKLLNAFLMSERGTVTVDWVTLTASVVGLGIAGVGLVSVGTGSLGEQVRNSLSGAVVGGQGYVIQRLSDSQLDQWTQTFADMTTEQLIAQVDLRLTQFNTHLTAEQWTQALQRVDYYHLISQELAGRGVGLPLGVPTAQQLHQTYLSARGMV